VFGPAGRMPVLVAQPASNAILATAAVNSGRINFPSKP
jgi:hypothetical protein